MHTTVGIILRLKRCVTPKRCKARSAFLGSARRRVCEVWRSRAPDSYNLASKTHKGIQPGFSQTGPQFSKTLEDTLGVWDVLMCCALLHAEHL